MMDPPFDFPQEDYALTILTHAAMHTHQTGDSSNSNSNSNSSYGQREQQQQQQQPPPLSSKKQTRNQSPRNSSTTNPQIDRNPINQHAPDVSQTRSPDISGEYNPAVLSTRNMETLRFNHAAAGRQLPYMSQGYAGIGSQISQNYANSLGILNAESYDDGRGTLRTREASVMGLKRRTEATMPFGITDHPRIRLDTELQAEGEELDAGPRRRKKPKVEAPSVEDDEEARKKARGRPRVDTKDETAADRRRTQIRMAQRAYRHRKETTISSLEKQVQDLRGTNEEMSNIFISLHDFAVNKGLLQREPEFGQQLQSTTERFLALAKATASEDHDENLLEDGEKHDSAEGESGRKGKGRRPSPKKRQEVTPPASEPQTTWGGYTLSKDDSPVEDIDMGFSQDHHFRTRQGDLQVITRPTEDNASFPFDLMDLQQYRVDVPHIEDYSQNFFPQSQPPLPTTYSFHEFSFARRIHRGAIEMAFKLVTTVDPSNEHWQRVFGFCSLYESKEAIERRLRRLMASTTKDTLQEWGAPFVHVGGAGTYYPMRDSDNNGELMPKLRTGYSMGPFTPEVTEVQEIVEGDMKCRLPGFEGKFFDPNDVEGYLRGHGLDIPPAADFITAELDLVALIEMPSPKSNSSDTVTSILSPLTPRSPTGSILIDTSNLDLGKPVEAFEMSKPLTQMPITLPFSPGYNSNWEDDNRNNNFIDPIFSTIPVQGRGNTPEVVINETHYGDKRTVTVNVKTLLDEIVRRGVCLGRAPGFRPADINAAIIAAVEAGF